MGLIKAAFNAVGGTLGKISSAVRIWVMIS